MKKTSKLPPVSINTRDYEKFKVLVESDGKTISSVLRDFVNAYNLFRVNTGMDINDFFREHGKRLSKRDEIWAQYGLPEKSNEGIVQINSDKKTSQKPHNTERKSIKEII